MSQPPTVLAPVFNFLDVLASERDEQSTWYIGLSGGMDSVVLLHLCVQWRNQQIEKAKPTPTLVALHINHGLSENSGEWQQFCQMLCNAMSVELITESVGDVIEGESNIESQARHARYSVFEKYLAEADLLLLGHHQDDQLETFLLRAFRGSGPTGLGAIPQERAIAKGMLYRPLLNISRDQLLDYAEKTQLSWIEDESNQNTDFDRNYIRHEIAPVIKSRWPKAGETVSRSAQLCQESQQLLDDLAELDLDDLVSKGLWSEPRLSCNGLKLLSSARQINALRVWFSRYSGFEQPILLPSQLQMQQILTEVINAPADSAAEVVWGQYCCRTFKGFLYLLDFKAFKNSQAEIEKQPVIDWHGGELKLPCGGTLSAQTQIQLDFKIQYRQGGESIELEKRGTKKLKTLLQELEVPPWHRERLPLIYDGDELIAVADLCQSAKAQWMLPQLRYKAQFNA